MELLTYNRPSQALDFNSGAVTGLSPETLAALERTPRLAVQPDRRHATGVPSLLGHIGKWVLAVSAATVPISYYDIRHDLRRSGSSSLVWSNRKRQGRTISFKEAWDQAGCVLLQAETRRAEQRELEARQWLWLVTEDDL